ncbi:MAG: alpha-L-arabinofuranosidase C-terminal domain-containing protein [Bacteroidales bacterium]|nr:alpha-L-arabinofuranosidase C-terminal domain-containing protein [Bacteroidales bacterium]
MKKRILGMMTLLSVTTSATFGQTSVLNMEVNTKKPVASINSDMYGVFFEDINFGADGGLYAELIKNRSFEFTDSPLMGWTSYGKVQIKDEKPCFERNPHYANLTFNGELRGCGLINDGFRGLGIKKGESYTLSFYARTPEAAKIRVELINSNNDLMQNLTIDLVSKEWSKVSAELTANFTDSHARIRLGLATKGSVDMDHISLFPKNTFKGRENGLRQDLAQALADLHPGVVRFPGGCIVEGNELASRYQWKNTVGKVENRPYNENRWNYEFQHRFAPDYFQSYGLGFFEFFQLAEDIGATALPVLNVGMSCQYARAKELVPLNELDPYIQDAIDLIEFANGETSTKWGALRAEMGHPTPFGLKYLAVGNEQWGAQYPERLALFVKELRKQHPEIAIIGSSGPSAEGKDFEYLWPEMKKLKVDLVDEHYYKAPEWFLANAARYDSYDRKGPKVFAGEYAAHTRDKRNNFEAALAEAAFMTGLERNADIVRLATYAPLFAHKDAWQWGPDLIWFDNLNMYKTPNYYVQQLYATNKGTDVLAMTMDKKAISGQQNIYASAALDKNSNEIILKIANTQENELKAAITLNGTKQAKALKCITFAGNPADENSLEKPLNIIPSETALPTCENNVVSLTLKGKSFTIVRIAKEK